MGPYKPLRNWVDEFILYGNNGSLDPTLARTYQFISSFPTPSPQMAENGFYSPHRLVIQGTDAVSKKNHLARSNEMR